MVTTAISEVTTEGLQTPEEVTLQAEPVAVEAPAEETATETVAVESPAEAKPDPKLDLNAVVEDLRKQITKLENDKKAVQGWARSQREKDDLLFSVGDRITQLEASNAGVAASLLEIGTTLDSGDGVLKGKLQEIGTTASQQAAEARFVSDYTDYWNRLNDSFLDDGGKSLIEDVKTAPELAEFRQKWSAATEKRDRQGLYSALQDAQQVARDLERKTFKQRLADAEAKVKTTKQTTLDETAALDLDTGPAGAGGATPTQDNIDTLYLAGKVPEDTYRRFLKTGEIKT